MQHTRKSQSAGQEEHVLLPRMASLRTPPRVDFNAYLNEQQDRHGIMDKVTSKLGGMFRGVKDVFGSIGAAFKPKEEPDTFRCSVSPSRVLVSSKDANFSSFRNNPINNVDFRELSNILKPNLPNDSFGPLNNSRNENNGNNISFGRANISNSHQEPLNQSCVSQSNSNSINDSNVSHKSSGKGSKKVEVKRKKRIHYNTASVINYWTAIFEENCKKYSLKNSQKRFSRNVKTILVEGIKKPIPQKKKFNSVDFKKNPATGAMEIVRHNKKRKNMEVEPLEDESLANMVLSKSAIQVEKDKHIQPQLKKNKLNANVVGSRKSSMGSTKNEGLITYRVQKRRTGAIFVDSCQEEEIKPVVKAKSPIRNLIFEEDKQCNRSTDTDSGFGEVRNHAPIANLTQEKGCQTSVTKIKMDTQIQTSPLRSRSLLLSASRKSYEELKEETMFKKNSRVQSKVASPINVKTDPLPHPTFEVKPKEEGVIPVVQIEIPAAAQENQIFPRTLNFDTSEENSRKDPISVSIANVLKQQQQQQPENSVTIEEVTVEERPTEKKSFLPEAQPVLEQQALPKNLFASTVPTPTPVQSQPQTQSLPGNILNSAPVEGKKSLTIRKLEVNPTKVETNNKPVFEFLKQYETTSGANKIKENNPFLNTSHQQISPNDALNTSAGNGGNPFLGGGAGGQSAQSGLLGLLERQSSEKKSNQSFELKPVTTNDLFGPKIENNNINNSMRNGLFNNIGGGNANNQGSSINPNLSNNTSSLFSHVTPKQTNTNTNLFSGPLIGKKDEMDIMDNRIGGGGGSVTNNLFSANPVQPQNNTPNFLQQQPSAQNNLFNFQNQQQSNRSGMSGMEVVNGNGNGSAQNSLFGPSNNLFGNSNNTSNNNTNNLFANTNSNNNNRPAIQLFSGSNNNNNGMNNNLFNSTPNNNGGFMENQMGFGNPQSNNGQLNLFNNPMQNSNNAAPNNLVFTSTSPFDNKPVGNNLFGNNNNNNFSNQNQAGFLPQPPPLQHNMSFGQQNNAFGNPNAAANFLNLGIEPNAGGQGGDNGMRNNAGGNDGNTRLIRRITQPLQKNRAKAFS